MKMIRNYCIGAAALSLVMVSTLEAAKVNRNYINIKSVDQFNKQIKQKKHTVVLFFDRSDKGGERAYNKAKKAYDAAADVELYKDQKDLQFLKVNTAYGDNHIIFDDYRIINDEDNTIARTPVIFLFVNGKVINNLLSGNITEKRVRNFVEGYFKDLRKKSEKTPAKKPAPKKMQQKKSSMY